MVFDQDGNYLDRWGIGAITDPHGMTIVDDIVYITDRSDNVAVKFTLDGKPLQVIGDRGVFSDTGCEKPGDLAPRAAGPFNYCTEMAHSPTGDIYVSDGYRNARVHRFNREGRRRCRRTRHLWRRAPASLLRWLKNILNPKTIATLRPRP